MCFPAPISSSTGFSPTRHRTSRAAQHASCLRASWPYRGRNVLVREVDGVHLNVQGTAIAAKVFAKLIADDLK